MYCAGLAWGGGGGGNGNRGEGRNKGVNDEAISDTMRAVEEVYDGDRSAKSAANVGNCNAEQASEEGTSGSDFRGCSGRKLLMRGN